MPFHVYLYQLSNQPTAYPLVALSQRFDEPVIAYKAAGAPDPPTATIFHSWNYSVFWWEDADTGLAGLYICTENGASSIFLTQPDQPLTPDTEIRVRGELTWFGFGPPLLDPIAKRCSGAQIVNPDAPLPSVRYYFVAFNNFTYFPLGTGLFGQAQIPGNRSPAEFLSQEYERVLLTAHTRDPSIPPEQPTRRTRPAVREARKPRPTECFDPITAEQVDCETGRPEKTDPCQEAFIKLPQWDDIVHRKPRPKLPWVQKTDPKTGKQRWALERKLTQEEAEEFIRRREVRASMERSNVNEIVQNVGAMMTWVDNIQDALLTAIVVARLGLKWFPAPVKSLLVGALGIADAMQIVSTGGIGLIGIRKIKGDMMRNIDQLPGSRIWNIQALERLNRVIPTWGELVQVLQTSDWIAGVGISLGPIVGLVLDILSNLGNLSKIGYRDECLTKARAAAIKSLEKMGVLQPGSVPKELPPPRPLDNYQRLIEDKLKGTPYEQLLGSPRLRTNPQFPVQPYTQVEYLHQLTAYTAFLDMAIATTAGQNIDELLRRAADGTIQAPTEQGRTEQLLEDIGEIPPQPTAKLPFPGSPTSMSVNAHARMRVEQAQLTIQNHINLDPTSTVSIYIRSVVDDIARKTLRLLDPEQKIPGWTLAPDVRAAHNALDKGWLPPPTATAPEIQAALQTLIANLPSPTEGPPSFDLMRRVLAPLGWTGP